ncbi:MAG: hypothetical protein HY566_00355 [Candidatus Kerfeldbacteria bacterium]|nr:hypothetical protein [Candidatus Kerfeldbacteria bacterium]
MPIKTLVCIICGQQVTKKSTLDLSVLDKSKSGRGCRVHPEVKQLVVYAQLLRQAEEIRAQKVAEEQMKWAQADRTMQVLTGIAAVRTLHTFNGLHPETVYAILRSRGYKEDVIAEIKKEVDRQGGPLMPKEEVDRTIAWAMLQIERLRGSA